MAKESQLTEVGLGESNSQLNTGEQENVMDVRIIRNIFHRVENLIENNFLKLFTP